MAKDLLTAAHVRTALPGDKPRKLADGSGLYLLIQPNGSKLWRFKFRLNGKEGLFAIGRFPEVTLADARAARQAAAALVAQGINPATQREAERQASIAAAEARKRDNEGTFERVAAAWLEAGRPLWAPGTYRSKLARVTRFLLPTLAKLPVAEIGPRELRPLLLGSKTAGAWAGIHIKGDLSGIFDFALVRGLTDSNPIPALAGLVRAPASESKAALSLAQVRAFFVALRAYRGYPETAVCLRLIALTACRPGEAADAEWSEFDLGERLWRRPAEKMKNRRDHVCPLTDQAVTLLNQLRASTGAGRYLFPHRTKEAEPANPARLSYAMRDMALGRGASPHCWRATFSTWANEQGFAPDAIERQLAHVERNAVRRAYNKALLLEERRRMLQAWADYLQRAEADNVVSFQRSGT
ncbi:tyrosine-type recombinase/integrase [Plasticicumulans sp.]|uniref:tyrosine-type recombinase/integrase n=1 Tax=Plasticicumulans sp. TaxID=2307179 RepID=UPI003935A7B2